MLKLCSRFAGFGYVLLLVACASTTTAVHSAGAGPEAQTVGEFDPFAPLDGMLMCRLDSLTAEDRAAGVAVAVDMADSFREFMVAFDSAGNPLGLTLYAIRGPDPQRARGYAFVLRFAPDGALLEAVAAEMPPNPPQERDVTADEAQRARQFGQMIWQRRCGREPERPLLLPPVN